MKKLQNILKRGEKNWFLVPLNINKIKTLPRKEGQDFVQEALPKTTLVALGPHSEGANFEGKVILKGHLANEEKKA